MLKPGYKQTDIGVLPEDWEVKALGEVLKEGRLGGNYPNSETPTEYPLIKMGNMGRGGIVLNKLEYVSTGTPENKHRLRYGDLIFNTRNTLDLVGKICVWRNELPEAYYNSNVLQLIFDPKQVSSTFFVNYFVNTSAAIARMRELATGTTSVAAIYTRDLLNFQIAVPPLAEQQAIAEALGAVDALLTEQRALLRKKQDLKQATQQALLTGAVRLPGFSGEWDDSTFGRAFTFFTTGSFSRAEMSDDGKVACLHYGDIHTKHHIYINVQAARLPFLRVAKPRTLSLLEDGDLVMADASEDYEGVGKSVEVKNVRDRQVVAGLHTVLLRPDKSKVALGFAALLPQMSKTRLELQQAATGVSVYGVTKRSIASTSILLPPIDEQRAIAAVLSDMDAELDALRQEIAKTEHLKQGMMQDLLTGTIRLTTAPAA